MSPDSKFMSSQFSEPFPKRACLSKHKSFSGETHNTVRTVILDNECHYHKTNLLKQIKMRKLKRLSTYIQIQKCIFDYFISPSGLKIPCEMQSSVKLIIISRTINHLKIFTGSVFHMTVILNDSNNESIREHQAVS